MGRQTSCFDNLKFGDAAPKQTGKPRIRLSRDENGKLYGWDDWRIKKNNSRPSRNRPKKRKAAR